MVGNTQLPVVLTTDQWPIVRCGRCNSTFTGPRSAAWFYAHKLTAHGAVILVK